jgi:type IV pilus assembly protein PilN
MIRINLLGVERQKKTRAFSFDIGQRLTLACSLILVVAALLIGWWYQSLNEQSARVDADIATAQQERLRLQSLIVQVQQFEQQRQQLQQRVTLIETLRKGQSIPVQLLDHVSRSLPDMLWLTQMKQDGADVTIDGRSTTLIAVSDFVSNLGTTEIFTRPIEIVSSQVEGSGATAQPGAPEVVRFTIKAQLAAVPPAAAPVRR